eukprot:5296517-Pyramimonas_sp.AAC.1
MKGAFSCHGKAGAVNAGDECEQTRHFPEWTDCVRQTYFSIGGQAGSSTTGKKRFPHRIVGSRGA